MLLESRVADVVESICHCSSAAAPARVSSQPILRWLVDPVMATSMKIALATLLLCVSLGAGTRAHAQRWRGMQDSPSGSARVDPAAWPAGIRIVHDVRYGDESLETFDVYAPVHAKHAPVIFMVHGGGWRIGDKAARSVVQNKVLHWVPRGIIVVSVDYPLLPGTPPLRQAQFVAKALAAAQRDAVQWGGDPRKFVLMGHSAGAHLVALVSAEPSLATSQGALPWLGTVALDSAAYDVATIMQTRHLRLYDVAFGSPAAWAAVSPSVQLRAKIAPFLAVCSSLRSDSCQQANGFADKARGFGSRAQVLPEAMRHGAIDAALGQPSAYTFAVDRFLASLDPALDALLH